jgi:alpha 1,3-glucosidase
VRVTIDEVGNEKYKRRKVANVLVNDDESYLELIESYSHKSVQSDLFEVDAKEYALIIDFRSEFVIKVLNGVNGDVVGLLNGNGWLKYETSTVDEKFPDDLSDDLKQRLNKDKGEESFKGHHDKKPYGPTAIGVDYSFFGVESVYGLAEHSDGLELKETLGDSKKYQDPYRLYNLDVFEFELDTNTALYGSVPLILGHRISENGGSWTSGFFWLNTAETWVDVQKFTHASKKHGLFFQSSNDEPESSALKSTVTHWISEAGLFDCFILVGGSKPSNVLQQYAKLTGSTALPQLFALGYHQCRWNYNDQADVNSVVEKFEQHDIPFDVLWLDIEHTDGKRYFTWDYKKFSSPEKMIDRLASLGRKVVTIIDPHIKKDPGYSVYSKAKDLNLFTSTHVAEGSPFSEYEGWCWPGASAYLDFLNPEARKYWMQQFSDYKGSTLNLFTWNDMNEPSVFNGPEITMPKDNLHFQRTEHREVHNIYGLLQHRSTYAGHIYRSLPNRPSTGDSVVSVTSFTNRSSLLDGPLPHRPFVLSRAFFSGTQRFGAIWTGDNMAKWEHLESTIPMLLGVSLSGIGFCGADIGGFFFDPSSELLVRWYQSGLFYPFFRAHAHIDTKRREPWLFGEENMKLIKSAIQLRYKLLWVYYTLFRRAQVTGELSIIRPVWYEFPNQGSFLSEADSFMVGSSLYVKPIVKPLEKSSSIKFELPSGEV